MSTDSEIICRSQETPAAFAELYDRHAIAIHRYASRRIGAAADDVMSETFLVAFERRAAFDQSVQDARPWLYGIATTLLKKHRRQEAQAWKGLVAGAAAEKAVVADGPDDRLDAELGIRRLATAIRRMNARDRDALLLYAWGDLDYEGVARAMDVPVGTVRSRLNRARRQLRQASGRGDSATQEVEHGRADSAPQGA
ncbi:MAG TPA: sigma-70 family RNA polymerase sigma factor [Pseudolysinimonas sp.]